jgi:hypothetical protein
MATCSFSLKGSSLQNCVNTCNTETDNLCSGYCDDTCGGCGSKCPWKQQQPSTTQTGAGAGAGAKASTCFNSLITRLKKYSVLADRILKTNNNLSDSLENLSIITDEQVKKDIIYEYLTSMYELSTNLIASNFSSIKLDREDITAKKNLIGKNKESLRELMEILKTKERQYKINMGKYNLMVYETRMFQYLFFYTIVLLIIPLLYLFGALNKMVAVLGWLMLITAGIIYTIYKIKTNKRGRDQIFYSEFNFNKPTRENILRSRLKQELSPKCKKEQDTDEDEFDPKNTDIGDITKWKNKID